MPSLASLDVRQASAAAAGLNVMQVARQPVSWAARAACSAVSRQNQRQNGFIPAQNGHQALWFQDRLRQVSALPMLSLVLMKRRKPPMNELETHLLALSHRIVEIELRRDADALEALICDDYVGVDPSGALIDKVVSVGRYRDPAFQRTRHGIDHVLSTSPERPVFKLTRLMGERWGLQAHFLEEIW